MHVFLSPLRLPLMLILGGLLFSLPALGQTVYRWVDEQGDVHYGHAVPPEHAHRGYERLRRDGSVRERVERALTPDERAERSARLAREAEEEAAARNQESRDRLLLAAYNNEHDIVQTMELQIAGLNSQRARVDAALVEASARFEQRVARAAQLTRDGQPVPPQLTNSIQESRDEMRAAREELDEIDDREESIRNHFAAELERFRQLTGPRR